MVHVPAEPAPGTDAAVVSPAFTELLTLLTEVAQLCLARGRRDLAERLDTRRDFVAAPSVRVVVAGDYKAGKSTLVNALVGMELCPVDDDVATVVPTFVRYAEEPTLVVRSDGEGGAPVTASVPFDELSDHVSEKGNPANRRRLRSVEVGVPSALLRDGIVLVDTPGVGGLASEYTAATLASLSMAHAVLFVSDATQEYTAPELEFLAAARQACPVVMPVLTKVDLFPDWEVVRANDEAWLTHADLDSELVAISAGLSLHARHAARLDLEGESGLAALIDRLHELGRRGRAHMAVTAAADVHSVIGQLAAPLRAEQDALTEPEAVLAELVAAEDEGRRLAGGAPEWLLILDDGISDLDDEIEQELSRRLRDVRREAEQTVTTTDPSSMWDEFEANLIRHTSAQVGAGSQLLVDGANQLATRIAAHFVPHEATIAPTLSGPPSEPVSAGSLSFDNRSRTAWRTEILEAGWGGVGAMADIVGVLSISVLNPFSLVVGVLMSGRSLRHARQRELEHRRQQAMEAVVGYIADAKQQADRERQLALRRLRRELRSSYQRRADGLYRSARDSVIAARRALEADHAGREKRAAQIAAELTHLLAFDERADELAAANRPVQGTGS